MPEPLACRSVAEAHLYLDLIGAEPAGRNQRLEARGDDLVSVYTVTLGGERREIGFRSPDDPLGVQGFGGADPSEIIDPGQWMQHAERLAASVPANPDDVEPGRHAAVARRLIEAARSMDEVVKFIPAGHDEVPDEAFWTPLSQVFRLQEPGRFRRARLEAVARTYREIARRFGATEDS